ncbi:hypothetical protein Tco_1107816 [Tanacetum coccineum]
MAGSIARFDIKNFDGNGVQKHGCSKQKGCKQLGPDIKTRIHGVHDQKHVWFEVELQGAQGNREAKVIQSANGNVAENKEVKKSKKANLWKLLRCNA